jgi:hypothetical protein
MELKQEIMAVVETIRQEDLPKALEAVQKVKHDAETKGKKWNLMRHYKRVVAEDRELLKMLAQ